MSVKISAIAVVCTLLTCASAGAETVTVSDLASQGYEVKAVGALPGSTLIFMQKGSIVYYCFFHDTPGQPTECVVVK